MKSKREKERLIKELRDVPIVQIACQKTGIGRATFYRWRREDKEFAKKAGEALLEGSLFINDLAESQLISLIKERRMGSIIFWLKNRHPNYMERLKVAKNIEDQEYELSEGEKELLDQALTYAGLGSKEKEKNDKNL